MKRTLIFILSILLVICAIILSKYYEYKEIRTRVDKFNLKYEQYEKTEILGTDIATIINQAVDDNENALVKKDENGKYIQDDEKSVNVEIKITDFEEEKIYSMESLYKGGMNEFVKYYGDIYFKCDKIEYNNNNKVKYIMFTQISS